MQSTDWHNKYCMLAKEISTWSKDPSTKIGAVVIGRWSDTISRFQWFSTGN